MSMSVLPSSNTVTSEQQALPASNPWMEQLPVVLRSAGAIAILFSLYSFLFRGWEGGNDFIRYLMLLGHTALLAVIALISGHYLRDGKGPRLLLMLALVSVPVNFAILGGFIFAGVNQGLANEYPSFVAWSVGDLSTALVLSAVATLIMMPVILLGFRALARAMSGRMSVLYMCSNLVLLLPLRNPLWVSLLALMLGAYTLFISMKTTHQRTEAKTFEGMIAVVLQFLPVGILLGRNLWLYTPDLFMFTSMSVIAFIILRHCSQFLSAQSYWRTVMELSSFLLAVNTGMCALATCISYGGTQALAVLAGGIVAGGMCYELARRAAVFNQFYQFFAMLFVSGAMIMNQIWIGSLDASLISIVGGTGLLALACQTKQRSVFVSGSILTAVGTGHLIYNAIAYFDMNYWLAFAALGFIAIVSASLLESRGNKIYDVVKKYRLTYNSWKY